ncbi:MFS transporter, partial [Bacillus sp. LL01]
LPIVFAGIFLIGLGTTWIRVLLQAVQQMATDANYHGRMASYRMIGNQGSVVVSAPIIGWIAAEYGANYIYLSLMLPISLCVLFAIFQSRQKSFIQMTNKAA